MTIKTFTSFLRVSVICLASAGGFMHPKPLTQRSPAWMHYLVLKPNIRRDRPWCRILSAGKTVFRQFMGILPQSDPSLQQLARAFVARHGAKAAKMSAA